MMKLFAYKWPDATLSVVMAPNRMEAAVLLDEIASADPDKLVELKKPIAFDMEWQVESGSAWLKPNFSHDMEEDMLEALFPHVDSVKDKLLDEFGSDPSDDDAIECERRLKEAIESEKWEDTSPQFMGDMNLKVAEYITR